MVVLGNESLIPQLYLNFSKEGNVVRFSTAISFEGFIVLHKYSSFKMECVRGVLGAGSAGFPTILSNLKEANPAESRRRSKNLPIVILLTSTLVRLLHLMDIEGMDILTPRCFNKGVWGRRKSK